MDDRQYLRFHVSEISQVQPTCISQRAKTLFFIFGKLIKIVLGLILSSQSELSLIYRKTAKDTTSLAFYIDNIFETFKTYQEQYIFLRNHFFPRIVWSKLKLAFSKLKIEMTKIFALKEEHKIGKKIRLKSNKIGKIFT